MSTIGSGVLGVVQGQVPGKGKGGEGNASGASADGDFSRTIASLGGREGHGGQKGGRISISGKEQQGEQEPSDPRVKIGRRDLSALADALRSAGAEKDDASFEEKVSALLGGAARSGLKVRANGEDEKAPAGDGENPHAAKTGGGEATDVGNLLQMLAAQNTASQTAVAGAGKAAGTTQDGKSEAGAKSTGKVGAQADATAKGDASKLVDADGAEVPQSDTDKLFRLIRADGKGRDLDMSLSGSGDRAVLRDANPTGPKGETVTVVDARRYIGLAQTGNAAAVTTAITQDPEWATSLSATGSLGHSDAAATGKVVNTLKIQMNPIELGLVTATLRLHGDALVVQLQVETGEAYRQLSDDQDAIVRALRGQGFAVDQVSVQLSPVDRSANAQNGDQQQQQQFSSQPQAREGGRQGGGDGQGTFAGKGGSHEDTASDNASGPAGTQPNRSGGVYL